jgi:PAS domain S-box-containing protein
LRKLILNTAAFAAVAALLLAFQVLPMSAEKPAASLSPEERQWLDANRDSIVLWYNTDFPPIEFQTEDGNFRGLGADVVAMIEERLGVRFQKVASTDWDKHLAALESGECAIAPTIVRTSERERYAHFTQPYATVPVVIITARGRKGAMTLDDLSGLRVAVVSGYATERQLKETAKGSFNIVTVQGVTQGLRAVSFGEVDAFVENLAVAAYYIEKEGLPNLRVAGSTKYKFSWSLGVSRNYPLLFTAMQKALAEIPEKELEAARKQWISLEPHSGLDPETVQRIKIAGLFVLALVLSLAGISYLLKRRLNEKVISLRLAQQELQTQAERLSLALEATNDGLWDWNHATGSCYFSPRWYTMLGYVPGEMPADITTWEGLLHPEESARIIREQAEGLAQSDEHTHEYRARAKDGGYRWLLSRCKVVERGADGAPLRVVGVNADITERKLAEQALLASEERFAKAFHSSPAPMVLSEIATGRLITVNDRWVEMLGYSREEQLGQTSKTIGIWADPATRDQAIERLKSQRFFKDVPAELLTKSGQRRTVLWSAETISLAGQEVMLSLVFDYTERRQAEEALRESEARYRSVVENIQDMFYRADAQGRLVMLSPSTPKQLGYASVDDMLGRPAADFWLRPEDRQGLLERLNADGRVVDYELTLKTKAGEPVLVSTTSTYYRDGQGRVLGVEGIFRDITLRKRLELDLADQLAFRQALMDTIPYAVFYKGADARFLGFNKAYEEVFGVRREELIGKRVLDLEYLPLADRLVYQAEDEAVIASVGEVHKEMPIPFADGEVHQTLYSVNGFRQSDGSPGGLIGIIVDITERKKSESALREILQRLNTITATVPVVLYELVVSSDNPLENRFTYVSEKVKELLGVTAQAMVADPIAFSGLVHLADRVDLAAASLEAAHHGNAFNHEFRVVLESGEIKWIRAASLPNPVQDGPPSWSGYLMDITPGKLNELALAESEQRYRTIFENTPMGIFRTTYAGRFVEANRTLATMLGYDTPAEFIASVSDVGSDLYVQEPFKWRLREALLRNPKGARVEVEFKRRDGSRFQALINASLQFDLEGLPALLDGTIEDITERRYNEEKYRVLFEASPEAIFLIKDGLFADCNPQVLQLFECTREQMLGRSPVDFSPRLQPSGEESAAKASEYISKAKKGHVHGFEWQHLRCDGSHFTAEVSLTALNLFNEEYVLAFLRDVSERRQMQELMIQTEKMMSVGGLAAGMAHELNNPLGIIMQSVQNMQRRFSPTLPGNIALAARLALDLDLVTEYMRGRGIDEYMRGIQEAGDRAAKIIRTMLDFSRSSKSARVLSSVSDMLDTAVDLAANDYDLKKRYDFKSIRIERDYDPDLGLVDCTETEIVQVLLNIIKNAAQAMPDRRDQEQPPSLTLVTRRVNGAARIEIKDNGPGMDEATRKRVFEPFFTTKAQGEGTGLGLSVGFFIITQKHHGRFTVDSHPGKGTTFAIELPLE